VRRAQEHDGRASTGVVTVSAPTSGLGGTAVGLPADVSASRDQLLELTHVAMATFDADCCCTYANRRARELAGTRHRAPVNLASTLPALERDAPGLVHRLLQGAVTCAELTLERGEPRQTSGAATGSHTGGQPGARRAAHPVGRETTITVDRVLGLRRGYGAGDAPTAPPRLHGMPEVWRVYLHRTTGADDSPGIGLVALDVTRHRSYVAALTYQARVDPLTGLHNRRELQEHLAIAAAVAQQAQGSQRARRTGDSGSTGQPRTNRLYLVDLDDFKLVNDTYGHPAGDTVLRAIGARLTGVMRSGDVAARLGGDEFAILCRDLDSPGAAAVTRRIRTALSRPIALRDGHTTAVTASLGSVVVDGRLSADDLLARADAAMYAAKRRRHRPPPQP
jgi:diguanylate cyclase (GGDEF)-like protein